MLIWKDGVLSGMPSENSGVEYSTMPVSQGGGAEHTLRRNMNIGSLLFLVSGITGTIYLITAEHDAYGILAFFQGPAVLASRFAGAFASLAVAALLLATFMLSGFSYFFFVRAFSPEVTGFRYLRQYRALLAVLVVAYAEVLLVFSLTLVLGGSAMTGNTIVFGSGGIAENILYVLFIILFLSFGIFMVAGSIMGNLGFVLYSHHLMKRYDLIALYLLLFCSIYYFPVAIVAGGLGVYIANSKSAAFSKTSKTLWSVSRNLFSKFLSDGRAQWIALGIGSTVVCILFILSALSIPVYHNGNLIYYVSTYMNGISGNLIALGLVFSAMVFTGSVIVLLRKKRKLVRILIWTVFWTLLILEPALNLYFLHYGSFPEQTRVMLLGGSMLLFDLGLLPIYIAFLLFDYQHKGVTAGKV